MRYSMRLDPQVLGALRAECAHCGRNVGLSRHRLIGTMNGVPVPSGEALLCPACRKVSRQEGALSRILSIAFLIPFLLILAAAAAAGLWFAGSVLVVGPFSAGILAGGLLLAAVPGWLGWRVLRLLRRLASGRLLRLEHLQTSI